MILFECLMVYNRCFYGADNREKKAGKIRVTQITV